MPPHFYCRNLSHNLSLSEKFRKNTIFTYISLAVWFSFNSAARFWAGVERCKAHKIRKKCTSESTSTCIRSKIVFVCLSRSVSLVGPILPKSCRGSCFLSKIVHPPNVYKYIFYIFQLCVCLPNL